MDKRYQVFISSTFTDLEGARQEVSQALLQTECFPAGMELFPAADEEQFEFIKRIIDESDYYVLISAGRYGSIHPETELSYTEMEYDYAVETGTPVLRLLHKAPEDLPGKHLERTAKGKRKLEAFRAKVSDGSLVKFWEDPKELGQHVILGLTWLQRHKPAVGWARVDAMAAPEAIIEIEQLKREIAELKLALRDAEQADFDPAAAFTRLPKKIGYIEFLKAAYSEALLSRIAEAAAREVLGESEIDPHTPPSFWEENREIFQRVQKLASELRNLRYDLEAEGLIEVHIESESPSGLPHTQTHVVLPPEVRAWVARQLSEDNMASEPLASLSN